MRRPLAVWFAVILSVIGGVAAVQAQTGAAGSFESVGSLHEGRFAHTATLLQDGRVVVIGGFSFLGALSSTEFYDPASSMISAGESLAVARQFHTASRLPDGRVLVAGGMGSSFDPIDRIEVIDPAGGSTTEPGSTVEPRMYHTATRLPDGGVHFIGGFGAGLATTASTEIWEHKSGESQAAASLATDRGAHTSTLLPDGRILVVGGGHGGLFSGEVVPTAEIHDPNTGRFTEAGSLPRARGGHSATLLDDGRVLIVGGSAVDLDAGEASVFDSAFVWDPESKTFQSAGALAQGRSSHTATLLPDGRVLVIGGTEGMTEADVLAGAEIWDPSTASFEPAGMLAAARSQHTATLQPDGTVLVVGGLGTSGPADPHSLVEVWSPTDT